MKRSRVFRALHPHRTFTVVFLGTLLALRCDVDDATVLTRSFPEYLRFLAPFLETYLQYTLTTTDESNESGGAGGGGGGGAGEKPRALADGTQAVSYTHLTLPTIYSV